MEPWTGALIREPAKSPIWDVFFGGQLQIPYRISSIVEEYSRSWYRWGSVKDDAPRKQFSKEWNDETEGIIRKTVTTSRHLSGFKVVAAWSGSALPLSRTNRAQKDIFNLNDRLEFCGSKFLLRCKTASNNQWLPEIHWVAKSSSRYPLPHVLHQSRHHESTSDESAKINIHKSLLTSSPGKIWMEWHHIIHRYLSLRDSSLRWGWWTPM